MTIATTSYGTLRGEPFDGLTAFRGVPYARPPLGELRFPDLDGHERALEDGREVIRYRVRDFPDLEIGRDGRILAPRSWWPGLLRRD